MREDVMRVYIIRFLALVAVVLLKATIGHAETPLATVTFDNKSGQPALVKLVGPTGRVVQVPNGQKRTVTAVGGQYHIVTRYGANSDGYTYSKGDHFKVTQTAKQHSIITITLHKVVDGNYPSTPIDAAEFDKAKQ
jgi:ABC-type Fe3+-hydroxamate transport system substrate-binding protein